MGHFRFGVRKRFGLQFKRSVPRSIPSVWNSGQRRAAAPPTNNATAAIDKVGPSPIPAR
jgi:hypothetical protein